MTASPALKHDTLYEQLCKLPENVSGESLTANCIARLDQADVTVLPVL